MCNGSELFLADCSHRGIGVHNCNHFEDAGVDCGREFFYWNIHHVIETE